MCKIYDTRKSSKYVYISLDDEENKYYGVKKLPIEKFNWAKKFQNMNFLSAVSLPTKGSGRDEDDAMVSVYFEDPDITYSEFVW